MGVGGIDTEGRAKIMNMCDCVGVWWFCIMLK